MAIDQTLELLATIADLRDEIASLRAHDEPMIAALHEGQDKLRAELDLTTRKLQACYESEREVHDGTDFAHPAWFRGSDQATKAIALRLQKAIGGEDNGGGTLGDPGLEAVRRWILQRRTR